MDDSVAHGTSAGKNGERSPAGDLDEMQMHLTCLPERYMRAKFTLSAYILCWTVLKLCQVRGMFAVTKLRILPAAVGWSSSPP